MLVGCRKILFGIFTFFFLVWILFCFYFMCDSIFDGLLNKKTVCIYLKSWIGWYTDIGLESPIFLLLKKIVFFLKYFKPTKPTKPTAKNRTAIGRKTDPRRCASVLIMKKLISIGSVINLKKNHPYRTVHTPTIQPNVLQEIWSLAMAYSRR